MFSVMWCDEVFQRRRSAAYFYQPLFPDLISHLLGSVVEPWTEEGRQAKYEQILVPDSYTGPRLSFPLSVADTNSLLSAFKEQQV